MGLLVVELTITKMVRVLIPLQSTLFVSVNLRLKIAKLKEKPGADVTNKF